MPKITVIIVTMSLMLIIALTYTIINSSRKIYKRAKKKFSDRQLLELFMTNDYVLTIKQFMQSSELSRTEAFLRMNNWVNYGVVRSLYANDGSTYFQLKTKISSLDAPHKWKDRSALQVLETLLANVETYEISLTHLVWFFEMSMQEARKMMKVLLSEGHVKSHYNKKFQRVYVANLNSRGQELGASKINLEELKPVDEEKLMVADSDLLKLAIENDGRLTPTLICVEKKIPLDDAQDLLDKLYAKGAFHIEVDEYDGVIEYWLRDAKLYK